MNQPVQFLKDNAHRFCQFEQSELQPIISRVTGCSAPDAFAAGEFHCNMLSKWLCLAASGIINYDYEAFFKKAYENKLCNRNGYIAVTLPSFFQVMEIPVTCTEYPDVNSIPEEQRQPGAVFQIPVNGDHHFMSCGVDQDWKLYLFDSHNTTYRPYGGELFAALAVHGDKIDCFKKYA